MSGTYIFDQTGQSERERLQSLQDLRDPSTRDHLTRLGVAAGWRCLEVGAGAGGIACWLADRVGPSGHVLATDLNTRFLDDHGRDNLEIRRHDIVNDPLERGAFDLVHARAVLEHIPERAQVLARLIDALRPGGRLLLEDTDFASEMIPVCRRHLHPPEFADLAERASRALVALMSSAGGDPQYGGKLPGLLAAAGLEEVGAEVHLPFMWGGGMGRNFLSLTVSHLRGHLTAAGLLTDDEVEEFLGLVDRPDFRGALLPMVVAWGRRPAA
jgi:SAM-dependent methyltransferase